MAKTKTQSSTFFAPNKQKAKQRAQQIAKEENLVIVSQPRLAKQQIDNLDNWKTWKWRWKPKK